MARDEGTAMVDVDQDFRQVVALAQKGDYDGALSVVLAILRAAPDHERALVFRYTLEARLFQRSGQDHDAIKRYQAVLAMDPANREATSMLEKYAAKGMGRPRTRHGGGHAVEAAPPKTGPVGRRAEAPAAPAPAPAPVARKPEPPEPEAEIEVAPLRQRPPSRQNQPAVDARHAGAAPVAGASARQPAPVAKVVSAAPKPAFVSAPPEPVFVTAPPEPAFVSAPPEPVFVTAPPEVVSAPPARAEKPRIQAALESLHPMPLAEDSFPDADPVPAPLPRVSSRPPRFSSRPPEDERRRQPRAALSVEVGMHSDTNFYTGFTGDISEGGLFVATYNLLPIGSLVHVSFGLPGGIEIEAEAEVRWVRDPHDINEQPGLGVRFTKLKQTHAEAIHHFMDVRAPIFFDDEG